MMEVKAIAAVFLNTNEKLITRVWTYGQNGNWHNRQEALDVAEMEAEIDEKYFVDCTITIPSEVA